MIIQPRIRGFICTTAHPDGCAANVREQIALVKARPPVTGGPKKVLVLGASTGYGLSSRIVPAFACGADTLGVFFERPGQDGRPGSAGWYNTAGFEAAAKADGLYAKSLNDDAFSDEAKAKVIGTIKADLGQVDAVIYSLASPRRTDPRSGEVYKSCLKPIGQSYTNKTVNTDRAVVDEVTIDPATDEEIAQTVKVMGGEDWEGWIDALAGAGVLADEATTLAYSYIGPELTWPIYRDGTIGRAKLDLEESCRRIAAKLARTGGRAFVSVNKAVVTQASSAIPVVPLYISILFKEMKARGTHEGCTDQILRLFAENLDAAGGPALDAAGRIRLDDREMRADVQAAVAGIWARISTETLRACSDFDGYQAEFLRLFGFGVAGVEYEAETDPVRELNLAE